MIGIVNTDPYYKVITATFIGSIDEGDSGYHSDAETDIELIQVQINFNRYLRENIHDRMKVRCYDVICAKFLGPGSSGYPNSLEYTIGIWDRKTQEERDKCFESVVKLLENFPIGGN